MNNTHPIFERPIAHRGLWDEKIPENSLGAFRAAVSARYAIELDVRLTRDGVPVIFHDYDVARMTGEKGRLSGYIYENLKKCRLAGTEEGIPTLAEALALIAGHVPVLIEIKGRGVGLSAVRAVKEACTHYEGDVAVSSFNPLIVRWCRKLMPMRPCGQNFKNFYTRGAVSRFFAKYGLRLLWKVVGVVPDFFVLKANALSDPWMAQIIEIHHAPLLTWAPDTQEEYERVLKYTDNIIFEKFLP